MSDKNIKYAYKRSGGFKTTFSCTNENVTEEFFTECMKRAQTPREFCQGIQAKALCEQCEYFGRKAEFFSEWDGSVTPLVNGLGKELAE